MPGKKFATNFYNDNGQNTPFLEQVMLLTGVLFIQIKFSKNNEVKILGKMTLKKSKERIICAKDEILLNSDVKSSIKRNMKRIE